MPNLNTGTKTKFSVTLDAKLMEDYKIVLIKQSMKLSTRVEVLIKQDIEMLKGVKKYAETKNKENML